MKLVSIVQVIQTCVCVVEPA